MRPSTSESAAVDGRPAIPAEGAAAIASAIEDATGRRIAAMPISPTELYDLMRDENAERTTTSAARTTGVLR